MRRFPNQPICPECNRRKIAPFKNAKTCGYKECFKAYMKRVYGWNGKTKKHWKVRETYTKKCVICGMDFEAVRKKYTEKTACSPECAKVRERIRHKKYMKNRTQRHKLLISKNT